MQTQPDQGFDRVFLLGRFALGLPGTARAGGFFRIHLRLRLQPAHCLLHSRHLIVRALQRLRRCDQRLLCGAAALFQHCAEALVLQDRLVPIGSPAPAVSASAASNAARRVVQASAC